jgi:hypothetical protein
MVINKASVLKWFTGKSLTNATLALEMLEASIEAGYWLPKASTKVRAALSKANVIAKLAKATPTLETIGRYGLQENGMAVSGWEVRHNAWFGSFCNAQDVHYDAVMERTDNVELRNVIATVKAWASDLAPVAAAIKKLDMTRPKPVFTTLGVSPTVTATLAHIGVVGSLETLRACPIETFEVERVNPKTGKKEIVTKLRLVFPEGCLHGSSRHHSDTQCQACGHGISNPYNWVVLLIDDAQGRTHSLWVGRDCARNLFGIDVKGELEYEGR